MELAYIRCDVAAADASSGWLGPFVATLVGPAWSRAGGASLSVTAKMLGSLGRMLRDANLEAPAALLSGPGAWRSLLRVRVLRFGGPGLWWVVPVGRDGRWQEGMQDGAVLVSEAWLLEQSVCSVELAAVEANLGLELAGAAG